MDCRRSTNLMFPCNPLCPLCLLQCISCPSYRVRNSWTSVESRRSQALLKDKTLVSFDVSSLFTCMPGHPKLHAIDWRGLLPSLNKLVSWWMTSWICCRCVWMQLSHHLGERCTSRWRVQQWDLHSLWWSWTSWWETLKHYIDGTCTAIHPYLIKTFHDHLNCIEPCVQFTVEESDGRLASSDVQIVRSEDDTINISVFRKATYMNQFLSWKNGWAARCHLV